MTSYDECAEIGYIPGHIWGHPLLALCTHHIMHLLFLDSFYTEYSGLTSILDLLSSWLDGIIAISRGSGIFQFLTALLYLLGKMATPSESNSQEHESKDILRRSTRSRTCSGCHLPIKDHHFGDPSPYCVGPPEVEMTAFSNQNQIKEDVEDQLEPLDSFKAFKAAPTSTAVGDETNIKNDRPTFHDHVEDPKYESVSADPEEELLRFHLQEIQIQERNLRLEKLQVQINGKRQAIRNLESSFGGSTAALSEVGMSNRSAIMTNSDLRKKVAFADSGPTPLDVMLRDTKKLPSVKASGMMDQQLYKNPFQSGFKVAGDSNRSRNVNTGPSSMPIEAVELYLKPGAKERGKIEVLKIIDFVDQIVEKEEEQLLLDNGTNKLFLKGGPKKIKLEQVTMSQWVIGAIHILNHFIEGNKFDSTAQMQSYLRYTVKVMELAGKFEWLSVLKFDDDFWHIQALYNYPWLPESHHLHLTRLQPKQTAMAASAND